MGSKERQLHVFFFPMLAPGHMIPMVDLAKLFARRGVRASVVTTPSNAPAVASSIDRALESGHPVETLLIEFPSAELGLSNGCENLASVTSADMLLRFTVSTDVLSGPFERLLREHRPDAVVTDAFLPWTVDITEKLGMPPPLAFHTTSFFSLCVGEALYHFEQQEGVSGDDEPFAIPGLPHRVELCRSQLPDFRESCPAFIDYTKKVRESEARSYGVVVNSFYEMEPDYARHYREVVGRRAWHVGPVSLCNEYADDLAARGGKAAVDHTIFLSWLDTKDPSSVLYVCFGSLSRFTAAQLREIAAGLEASGHPFIWVLRKAGQADPLEWLPEGLVERTAGTGRGMLITGWAPQVLILNHGAVGGFVTHCGWNSCLEGIAAGVPMVTWPLFAEQFYNERLLVDVLRIGVPVGSNRYAVGEERPLVKAEIMESAVEVLMGGDGLANEMRTRARELKEAARLAVKEGGSSYDDMDRLIQELVDVQK